MTSGVVDISALLSKPSSPKEQLEASDDIFAVILESIKSNEKEVEISPEEAAWADSCLVQTSELSEDDWGAMKKALLDALDNPTDTPYDTSIYVHEEGLDGISEAKSQSLNVEEVSRHNDVHMEQRNNSEDDKDNGEASEVYKHVLRGADEYAARHENPEVYKHALRGADEFGARHENPDKLASSEVHEVTESKDSIFKVWDLEPSLSDDEGELIKELKKRLKDNPLNDTSEASSQINIDALVADLSDLSLRQIK